MSSVHVRHIRNLLEKEFRSAIDISDVKGSDEQKTSSFLSRAQAAYAITMLSELDFKTAAACVTDGHGDNGLDAVCFDADEKKLFLVQSKWHHEGTGSMEVGDILKFGQGVRHLINADFARFNAKVGNMQAQITAALDDPSLRVQLVLVHTGVQKLADQVKAPVLELIDEINDATNIASYCVLDQSSIHKAVSSSAEGASVRLEIMLHEWGQCKQPYSAYYGQVEAADIAKWWADHQQMLFAKNLRKFTGSTDVNEGIKQTLVNDPSKFWYFNNGVTILCSSLKKKAIGGNKRGSGVFVCEGVSVVNGAQTVGCIGNLPPGHAEKLANAKVSVRLISLAKCPEEFGMEITRAANTQNRIERRDFAALDPEQERLRQELHLDLAKSYAYKSGDSVASPKDGCTIEEATIALACAHKDIAHSVQAKREVGKLWEDITRAPYKLLFNPQLSAQRMWRLIEIMRTVEATLKQQQLSRSGKDRMIAVHGNRFVLRTVYRQLKAEVIDQADVDFQSVLVRAKPTTRRVLDALCRQVQKSFPSAYTNSLFKNATKCRSIEAELKVAPVVSKKASRPGRA